MKRRRETSSLPSSHPSLPLTLLVCANQCAINPIVSMVTGPECQKSEGKLFTGTKRWAEAAAAPSCCCQAAAPQHPDSYTFICFMTLGHIWRLLDFYWLKMLKTIKWPNWHFNVVSNASCVSLICFFKSHLIKKSSLKLLTRTEQNFSVDFADFLLSVWQKRASRQRAVIWLL